MANVTVIRNSNGMVTVTDEATARTMIASGRYRAATPTENRRAAESSRPSPQDPSSSYRAPSGSSTTTAAAATAAETRARNQASASVQNALRASELEELIPFVDRWMRDDLSQAEIDAILFDHTTEPGRVVDRIYPELREVREAGLPPIDIATIQNTRRLTMQGLSERGVAQYLDARQLAHDWLVKGTSVNEGLDRVDAVAEDALTFARSDPELSGQLEAWSRFYGIEPTAADVLGMAVKPQLAVTEIKRRAEAVRLDVEAGRAGFGDLSVGEAERLTDLGVDARQSASTFGALARSQELFTPLDRGEDEITREEQLNAGFGISNAEAARRRVEARARRRTAQFEGGGGLATSRSGFGGLSTSSDT